MDLGLTDKVAIVTGASRGIGRAIACRLSEEGAKVILVARSRTLLDELAKSLPGDSLVYAADLREAEVPAKIVEAAVRCFGRLDIVVNNAGATQRGAFLALDDLQWADGFALKFFGAMRLCRAAWPQLKASQGCIVNIVGIGGRMGNAEFAIGGSVNAALLNLTKALADLGTTEGVRVNAINPGSIRTDRLEHRIARYASDHGLDQAEAARRIAQDEGIARFGEADEIARAAAFLASPLSAYIHGAILDIDGGQTKAL
jgi:3-oxoacyl-[acyl-carrier protein] reductase